MKGTRGDPGLMGPQGERVRVNSLTFIEGIKMSKFDLKGYEGPMGPPGYKGDIGDPGMDGISGVPGAPGNQGYSTHDTLNT